MASILLQTFQRLLHLHLLPQCCPSSQSRKHLERLHSQTFKSLLDLIRIWWGATTRQACMPDTNLMSHQTRVSATWRRESTDSIPSSLAQPLVPTSPKSSRFKAQGRYLRHKAWTSTATGLHPRHALSSSHQPCASLIVGTTYSTAED